METQKEITGQPDLANQKLLAEINKLEAEREKIISEKSEIERRIHLPWYKNLSYMQMLISALLGTGAFFAFYKLAWEPAMQRDNILLGLDLAYQKDSMTTLKKELKVRILKYDTLHSQINHDMSNIKELLNYIMNGALTLPQSQLRFATVFYEYDKATLTTDEGAKLDQLFELLMAHPSLNVELRSHVSSEVEMNEHTSEEYARKLSERRSQSVKEYLVKKGIKQERIIPFGMGSIQPLFNFENYQIAKPYSLHPFNRCTEIFITI